MRILLAEDDHSQAESIKIWLEMDGYTVDWVERGDHAILAIEYHEYDCLLLDCGLSKVIVDEILKATRQKKLNIPVIFLTVKDRIQELVDDLDLGANDYLVKPFSLEELSARVRSQLRQKQAVATSAIEFANLMLDVQAKQLKQDDKVVDLTAKEFQILNKLMQNPSHIVTREQLENFMYAWGDEIESNAIEVFICQIRKKIGSHYIKTVRGLGYRMSQDS